MTSLQQTVEAQVATGLVPGAVALVADGDEITAVAAGVRAVGGAPMTRDTLFRIASITKPIVAAAVMALVDRGLPAARSAATAGRPAARRVDGAAVADTAAPPARRGVDVQHRQRHPRRPARPRRGCPARRRPRGPGPRPVGHGRHLAGLRVLERGAGPAAGELAHVTDAACVHRRADGGVDLASTEPWNVPGRYGWVGGTGTAAYVIPSRRRVVIWMSQVTLEGPDDARAIAAVLTWAAQQPHTGEGARIRPSD